MAGGGIGRTLGAALLVLMGVTLAGAGALGLPQKWLKAAGLDPASERPAPAKAGAEKDDFATKLQQREAAVQARELALAQKEKAVQERELEWVRSLQKLTAGSQNEAAAQVAGLMEKMPPRQAAERLAGLDDVTATRVFLLLSENQAVAVLGQLSPTRALQLLTDLGKGGGRP